MTESYVLDADDYDRMIDVDCGELDGPEPESALGVVDIDTEWEPEDDAE